MQYTITINPDDMDISAYAVTVEAADADQAIEVATRTYELTEHEVAELEIQPQM